MIGPFTRHNELPILSAWPDRITAVHFNIVQRALSRENGPIRLKLPKMKTLDIVLQRDSWITVDCAFHDLPVLAWTDFKEPELRGLHEPILCELRYFHGLAGMVVGKVLDLVEQALTERMGQHDGVSEVLEFSKP